MYCMVEGNTSIDAVKEGLYYIVCIDPLASVPGSPSSARNDFMRDL